MTKKIKDLLKAKQFTRLRLKNCIAERGQGLIYLLGLDEIYGGVYLDEIDGELFAPGEAYDGELKSEADIEAYYDARTRD